jgi:5-methylcytosine-specific restriction endonuclease McrBC regulatory subunit McrC
MNNFSLPEGGSIELSSEYIELALKVKSKNPTLPFQIEQSTLRFDDYVVGELLLKDLSIKLIPRNKAFNLHSYFQILCYLNGIEDFIEGGTSFSEGDQLFNIFQLSKNFCNVCNKLLQFGLTGSYFSYPESSFAVEGEIDFAQLFPQKIPMDGIPQIKSEYTLDIPPNRLIKAAISKLCEIEGSRDNSGKFQILRDLAYVQDYSFTTRDECDELLANFYTPNPWYIAAIDLSKKILFELELKYMDGAIEWMSFLQNTNTLFEEYVRKILQDNLLENVSKWETPKPFLKIRSADNKIGDKSYSPDILINYNSDLQIADVVLDVKNKTFEPSKISTLDSLTTTNDIYQLFFYCHQLKARLGGLIYPSTTTNAPVELMIDSAQIKRVFAFSINMKEPMLTRHQKLSREVYSYLLREL